VYDDNNAAFEGSPTTLEATDTLYDWISAPTAAASATSVRSFGQFGTAEALFVPPRIALPCRQGEPPGRLQDG
jgi:hypothetical protein